MRRRVCASSSLSSRPATTRWLLPSDHRMSRPGRFDPSAAMLVQGSPRLAARVTPRPATARVCPRPQPAPGARCRPDAGPMTGPRPSLYQTRATSSNRLGRRRRGRRLRLRCGVGRRDGRLALLLQCPVRLVPRLLLFPLPVAPLFLCVLPLLLRLCKLASHGSDFGERRNRGVSFVAHPLRARPGPGKKGNINAKGWERDLPH